jgi:putative copper export protein
VVVAILTAVYSRATDLKLPNRDYWLAPERIDRTRAFLVAHGVWFGSLLVVLACFVHWLELAANRAQPPHLSNSMFAAVMIAFLLATTAWIAALMVAFRRPA